MTVDIVGHLTELGFTEYEARAYATLVTRSPLTGYEVAKMSGVPRPNIYAVIERLQQKGAVLAIHEDDGVKYTPVPPTEMLGKLARSFRSRAHEAEMALKQIQSAPQADLIWNVQAYEDLMDKAKSLLDGAQREALLAVWPAELEVLGPELEKLKARLIEPTILHFQRPEEQGGEHTGGTHAFLVARNQGTRWLVIAVDEAELLVAEASPDGETKGAWTRNALFASLGAWYVRHGIAAAEIVRSLGKELLGRADDRALATAGAANVGVSQSEQWLEGLLRSVEGGQNGPK